jgi:hypothetical protein
MVTTGTTDVTPGRRPALPGVTIPGAGRTTIAAGTFTVLLSVPVKTSTIAAVTAVAVNAPAACHDRRPLAGRNTSRILRSAAEPPSAG